MTRPSPLHSLAWCWTAHGLCMLLLVGIAWLGADALRTPAYLQLWADLGLGRLHAVLQATLTELASASWAVLATGAISSLGGLAGLRLPSAGALLLHVAALIHLVGLPWFTWLVLARLHGQGQPILHEAVLGGLFAVGGMVGAIASSIALRRLRGQAAAAPSSSSGA